MRIPSTPPDLERLRTAGKRPNVKDWATYWKAVEEINREYLTWDEVSRRDSLKRWGTSDAEILWLIAKVGRLTVSRPLPLLDKNDRPFQFVMSDSVQEGIHHVDKYATGSLSTTGKSGVPPAQMYVVSSAIEEAISSSILEGAATTRKVAKEMIRTGRKPRTTGERMALNNYQTLLKVKEYLHRNPDQELTMEILHELHRTIAAGTLEDERDLGSFRASNDIIVVDPTTDEPLHVPPPFEQLDSRMSKVLEFANDKSGAGFIHPVVRGMIVHFMIGYEHPYVDGNGRMARALFYWYLLRHGYWAMEYLAVSRAILGARVQYGTAYLNSEIDGGDLTYFLIYHLKMIRKAIESFQSYVARKQTELESIASRLRIIRGINHRQMALLDHALRHPEALYSISGHAAWHGITRMTARADLKGLEAMELLESHRLGRRIEFGIPNRLQDRIESLSRS